MLVFIGKGAGKVYHLYRDCHYIEHLHNDDILSVNKNDANIFGLNCCVHCMNEGRGKHANNKFQQDEDIWDKQLNKGFIVPDVNRNRRNNN